MLRTRNPVHALSPSDRDAALEVCAQNLPANVFVAARLLEGVLSTQPGTVLGHKVGGTLESLCWSSANLVPVEADDETISYFADRVRRWRRHCASVLGPSEQVTELWRHLEPAWGPARAVRTRQPLMSTMDRPSALGIELDQRRPPRHRGRGRPRPAGRGAHVRGRDRLPALHRLRRRIPLRTPVPHRPGAHLRRDRGRCGDLQGRRRLRRVRLRPAARGLARAAPAGPRASRCR